MSGQDDDVAGVRELLADDGSTAALDEDELINIITEVSDNDTAEFLLDLLLEHRTEDIGDVIATSVADQLDEKFPELGRKSRPFFEVLDEFAKHKLEEVDSKRQYERKIEYIRDYFESATSVETTDEMTSEHVENYERWRKYESLDRERPLADSTLRDDMYLFDDFIDWLIEHNMVPMRFEKKIDIPKLDRKKGEGVDEKMVDPDLARAALDYLRKYERASLDHILVELFCQGGTRKSDCIPLDIEDVKFDENPPVLEIEHKENANLKKDEASNREITLYGDLPEYLREYLKHNRPSATDEDGNRPLFTMGDGRISKSTVKKIAYKWTRPCKIGLGCPHDRDPNECEAAQRNNDAFKCPSSRAPHHFRKGYITHKRNANVNPKAIEQRCDVSPRVQALHYDLPDQTEERERYEDEFEDADEDSDSGYSH